MSAGLEADVRLERGSLALDVSLVIDAGTTVAVVGPNGAGKTTLLRALAGLDRLTSGRIALEGVVFDEPASRTFVPPEARRVGFVFQDDVLFPHLSVLDNVAFPLRSRGASRGDARRRADSALDDAGIGELAPARPSTLSGGQAQRVALARALVAHPRLLLLDEPFAALDATTKARTRRAVASALAGHDGARIFVTHDPVDALSLAQRIVVLEGGRVVQDGSASELAARPGSAFVADLLGVNLLRGRAEAGGALVVVPGFAVVAARVADAVGAGDAALAVFHPRAVALHRSRPEGTARNVWQGSVGSIERDGTRARLRVTGPVTVVAEVTASAVDELDLAGGGSVWVSVKATEIELFSA
ncbi:MAG TPA: ABC transporter ATP-binding protein [Acidimicrobiales bacterium]